MATSLKTRLPDLSWLKPPQPSEDGRMALVDHLRELRYRIVVASVAIVVGTIVAYLFYQPVFDLAMWPYNQARAYLRATRPDLDLRLTYQGISASFMMRLRVAGIAGVIATCPIWLYQLWAFIVPGLLAREKKWALTFLATAVPLFLSGVTIGYLVLPKGYQVMIGFVPKDSDALALLEANTFLTNEIKLLMVFGVSFLLPVVLVMLNLVGVVKGEQLRRFRIPAVFGCFVFGAIATPSTDPFSMTAMAVPMALLYYVAEVICRRHDKHKAARADAVDKMPSMDVPVD